MYLQKKALAMHRICLAIFLLIQSTIAISLLAVNLFATPEKAGKSVDGKAVIDSNNMLSGTWIMHASNLKTDMENHDDIMMNSAGLHLAQFKLSPISAVGGNKKAFSGELTLNGITQPISGIVDLSEANADVKFKIDIAKFGINLPRNALLTIGKDINVGVTLDL